MNAIGIHVRWMIRQDIPEVLAVESACPHPWGEQDLLTTLWRREVIGMVAEREDRVLGFMVYALRRTSLDLLRFAVHPDYRRRQVGSEMLHRMGSKLSSHRRNCILTVVRESDLGLQLFLKYHGFKAVRVLRRYFGDEDGYRMVFSLEELLPHNRITEYLEVE
jgi:ribosomal-protein-alanine N-acetyltransferase